METFKTLIKKEHENSKKWNSGNEYVVGRISGISLVLCGEAHQPIWGTKEGKILIVSCEPEDYEHFMCIVEKRYPGLCEFNYEFDLKKQ